MLEVARRCGAELSRKEVLFTDGRPRNWRAVPPFKG
jgi:hypothetical protein